MFFVNFPTIRKPNESPSIRQSHPASYANTTNTTNNNNNAKSTKSGATNATATESELKLEKHLKLLKEEYTKLQRNYNELERKYSRVVAASGDPDLTGEFSSFVSRLALTVGTLYGRKTYSDLTVRLADKSMPAHKFVLNARSEEWREEVLADSDELGERTGEERENTSVNNFPKE